MELITIPHSRGVRLVKAEDIIRVESLSNYSRIYFSTGYPMTVAKVLHWFEEHLPPHMFARVHRSHLVNKLFVQKITGTKLNHLLLSNGECIAMSKRKKMLITA